MGANPSNLSAKYTQIVRLILAIWLISRATLGIAATLPTPEELQNKLNKPPITVSVVEPHMLSKRIQVRVDYVGYPLEEVLTAILGAKWNQPNRDIEFRALDGYVSRIPAVRFAKYHAYLVFARKGAKEFYVDNLAQNEKRISLGPYYLVWDNIAAPELLAEGATHWPYQVTTILLTTLPEKALLPGDVAAKYKEHAALAQIRLWLQGQFNNHHDNTTPTWGARRVLDRVMDITAAQLMHVRMELHSPELMLVPDVRRIGILEFYRAKEAIAAGRAAATTALPEIHKIMRGISKRKVDTPLDVTEICDQSP